MDQHEYPIDIMERHLQWLQADEGKILWHWLEKALADSMAGSERLLGAHEMEKIIKANKALATQQTYGYVSQYRERLVEILKDKKKRGIELTSLEEL